MGDDPMDPQGTPTPSPPAPSTPPAPPTPPTPAAPSPPPPAPAGQPAPTGQPGDGTDWKAEARKWETRAKENSDAAARLKEIDDAQKTEQQKLTEQLEATKADGAKSATELLRLDVALDKAPAGMEPAKIRSLAARLKGSTREELEADAAELFADFAAGTPPPPTNGGQTPVANLRPGALPTQPEPTLADQVAAAEKAGDWALAQRLKAQQLLELHKQTT